jgi:hypothetical protein
MKNVTREINAQTAREALAATGWIPLVKIGDSEHWAKDNRRCIIVWGGEKPQEAMLTTAHYVQFVHVFDDVLAI